MPRLNAPQLLHPRLGSMPDFVEALVVGRDAKVRKTLSLRSQTQLHRLLVSESFASGEMSEQ